MLNYVLQVASLYRKVFSIICRDNFLEIKFSLLKDKNKDKKEA